MKNEVNVWWNDIGSGIVPEKNEDHEEHTRRVCQMFYEWLNDPCKKCMMFSEDKKRNEEFCKFRCSDYDKNNQE